MVWLTDSKYHPLKTQGFEYRNDLPEYPSTHLNGYTYCIYLTNPALPTVLNMMESV